MKYLSKVDEHVPSIGDLMFEVGVGPAILGAGAAFPSQRIVKIWLNLGSKKIGLIDLCLDFDFYLNKNQIKIYIEFDRLDDDDKCRYWGSSSRMDRRVL